MSHRVFELAEGATCYVAGFHASHVWIREERAGVHALVALDPETGAERRRWPLTGGMPYTSGFFGAGTAALVLDGDRTHLVDPRAKTFLASLRGKPVAVALDGASALLMEGSPHALVSAALPSFAVRTRAPFAGYNMSFGSLGAAARDAFLYRSSEALTCVDHRTLEVRWAIELPVPRWEWEIFAAGGRAFSAQPVETRQGPTTEIAEIDLATGARTRLVTLAGSLRAHSNGGDFLLAQLDLPDGSHDVVAWLPGAHTTAFRFGAGAGGWAECCQVTGAVGVVSRGGALDVFAPRDGRLLAATVPQPPHYTSTATVGAGRVFSIAGALFSVEVATLALAAERVPVDVAFAGAKPRTLAASFPPPDAYVEPPRRNLAVLRESAERFGFVIPPLLERLIDLHDADDIARGWIRSSGLEISVDGFAGCWIGVDPAFLGFAGDGSGQQWGLYLYPPRMKPGVQCGYVYWDHETRGVSWCGSTVEEFLSRHLARMEDDAPDKLAFLLERLGLPPDFARDTWEPPPSWFASAHGDDRPTLAQANAAIDADPIDGERLLVAYVRQNEKDDEGIATMEILYERLGWRFHRENLRHLKHDAKR